MKAPEKIFICDYGTELGFEWHAESNFEHQGTNDIEYTHTDAFIEKAVDWLKEIFFEYENLTDYNPTEDFKNYMKGE